MNKVRVCTLLWGLIPLVLLVVDWLLFPTVINGCRNAPQPTAETLHNNNVVRMGSLSGHEVFLSREHMGDSTYLNYLNNSRSGWSTYISSLTGGSNALAITIDLTDPAGAQLGALAQGVIMELQDVAPDENKKLSSIMGGSDPLPGAYRKINLQVPITTFSRFPVDTLYLVGISYDSSATEKEKSLAPVMQSIISASRPDRIRSIVLPCLAVRPGNPKALSFEDFFQLSLASLSRPSWWPRNLYFSLFSDWNDADLSHAVGAMNNAWNSNCKALARESVLYHEDSRLIFVGCSLAMVVSAFFVPPIWRNAASVFVLFVGSAFAVLETANKFLTGMDATGRLWIHFGIVAFLAALFPKLAHWNPKGVFES